MLLSDKDYLVSVEKVHHAPAIYLLLIRAQDLNPVAGMPLFFNSQKQTERAMKDSEFIADAVSEMHDRYQCCTTDNDCKEGKEKFCQFQSPEYEFA